MPTYDAGLAGGAVLRLIVNQDSQSIPNNQSSLSYSLTLHKGSYSSWSYTAIGWSANIGGYGYGGSYTFDFSGGGTSQGLGSASGIIITHDSNGSKTISVSGHTDSTGTSTGGPADAGGSMGLTTIPRSTTPTFELVSAPGVNVSEAFAGVAIKIELPRASGTFTHTVEYLMGSVGATNIASGAGTEVSSWTIPMSLLNEIPNALSGLLTIRVKTYSGATLIGTTNTSFTIKVPVGVIPTIGSITDTEATAGLAANVGAYVQGLTKLSLAIVGAAGAYSSTIAAYKLEVNGQTINAISGITPSVIGASGTVTITATVTDSRGKIGTLTKNVTVKVYAPPNLGTITAERALLTGVPDDNGTYIRVNINSSVTSLFNGTERNSFTYKIWTRDHIVGGAWTLKKTVTLTPPAVAFNSYDTVNTYAINQSWDVMVEILDDFGTTQKIMFITTAKIFMHWDGSVGVGILKYRQQGALDVGGDIYQNSALVVDMDDKATAADMLTGTDNTKFLTSLAAAGNREVFYGQVDAAYSGGYPISVTLDNGAVISAGSSLGDYLASDLVYVVRMTQGGDGNYRVMGKRQSGGSMEPLSIDLPISSNMTPWDATIFQYQVDVPWDRQPAIAFALHRSTAGVVTITGLGRTSGSITNGTVFATLPVGFRPPVRMRFGAELNGVRTTIDVYPDGTIRNASGSTWSTGQYFAMSNVRFYQAGQDLTWTALTLSGTWAASDAANYGTPAYAMDAFGDVWFRGLVTRTGGWSDGLAIASALPVGYRPTRTSHMPSASTSATYIFAQVDNLGVLAARATVGVTTIMSIAGIMFSPTALDSSFAQFGAANYIFGNMPWQNSWVPYTGTSFTVPGVRKRADGLVILRGFISTGTIALVVTKLPSGAAPRMVCMAEGPSNNNHGRIDIQGDGNISIATGSPTWVSLDAIVFQGLG